MNKATEVFNKMMETDYFSQWMGLKALTLEEGHCVLQMTVRKEMLNGFGILHGGLTFAFADSALAFSANSRGVLSVLLDASATYPSAAYEGDVLTAEAVEMANGKKTGTYDITVKNQKGEVVGLFRGTVYRTTRSVI